LIELRIAQLQGRLGFTRRLHLVQEIGHVISAESVGGKSLFEGLGHLRGAVGAEQSERFLKLAEERAVGVSQSAQESFQGGLRQEALEQREQPLLRLGAQGGGALFQQLFLEAPGTHALAAPQRG
jgi:hypothetical protein